MTCPGRGLLQPFGDSLSPILPGQNAGALRRKHGRTAPLLLLVIRPSHFARSIPTGRNGVPHRTLG